MPEIQCRQHTARIGGIGAGYRRIEIIQPDTLAMLIIDRPDKFLGQGIQLCLVFGNHSIPHLQQAANFAPGNLIGDIDLAAERAFPTDPIRIKCKRKGAHSGYQVESLCGHDRQRSVRLFKGMDTDQFPKLGHQAVALIPQIVGDIIAFLTDQLVSEDPTSSPLRTAI